MHYHIQTKSLHLRFQFLPPLESWDFQVRFWCRRMSPGGRRRFGPPPPRRFQEQQSPHQWSFLLCETPDFLLHQLHRQNDRRPRSACASVSYYGWFASQ